MSYSTYEMENVIAIAAAAAAMAPREEEKLL